MATGAVVARILSEYSDKGTKAAQKDLKAAGKSFDDFGAKVKKSFEIAAVASAAFAVKMGVDSIKLAMADQQSSAILAQNLKNTTGANKDAIASTEAYVKATELRLGVVDTELRPSLSALVTATHDVTKAESLQQLALNISAGRGKDLGAVSLALAKAYDGNFTALKRLGIPLSETMIKNKDFTGIVQELSAAVKGDATVAADSLAGQMTRMQLGFEEAKKSLGYALMPAVKGFIDQLNTSVIPQVQAWIDLNKDQLVKGLKTAADEVVKLVKAAVNFGTWISTHMAIVKEFAVIMAALWAYEKVFKFVTAIGKVVAIFKTLKTIAEGAAIAEAFATGGANIAAGAAALAAVAVLGIGTAFLNSGNDADIASSKFAKAAQAGMGNRGGFTTQAQKDSNAATKIPDFISPEAQIAAQNLIDNKKLAAAKKLADQQAKDAKAAAQAAKDLANQQAVSNAAAAKAAEQALLVQIEMNKLKGFGIENANSQDPIELAAAEMNLRKQGAIAQADALSVLEQQISAQALLNAGAGKYADILSTLSDGTISTAEVETLSKKWGMSSQAVTEYIAKVIGIPSSSLTDPLLGAHENWKTLLSDVDAYLAKLRSTPTIPIGPNPSGGGGGGTGGLTPAVVVAAQGTQLRPGDSGITTGGNAPADVRPGTGTVVNVTVQGSVISQGDLVSAVSDGILRTVHSGSNFLQFSATGGL